MEHTMYFLMIRVGSKHILHRVFPSKRECELKQDKTGGLFYAKIIKQVFCNNVHIFRITLKGTFGLKWHVNVLFQCYAFTSNITSNKHAISIGVVEEK